MTHLQVAGHPICERAACVVMICEIPDAVYRDVDCEGCLRRAMFELVRGRHHISSCAACGARVIRAGATASRQQAMIDLVARMKEKTS